MKKTVANHLQNFGGRRFVMTMGCGIACTALLWFGKMDGPIFRDVIIATVAAYIAGNSWESVKHGPVARQEQEG